MKKKILIFIFIILTSLAKHATSLENKIILKVNNEIITTFDVKQERKYLLVLNPNLKEIDQNKLKELSIDSIIKEKIKEIELVKYYQIEQFFDDKNLEKIIKNLFQTLGFKKEEEFKDYLNTQNLKFSFVKKKMLTEMLWNNLIFKKFNNRVVIDENEIKNNLNNEIKNLKSTKDIFLSEILIRNSKDLKLDDIYSEILKASLSDTTLLLILIH